MYVLSENNHLFLTRPLHSILSRTDIKPALFSVVLEQLSGESASSPIVSREFQYFSADAQSHSSPTSRPVARASGTSDRKSAPLRGENSLFGKMPLCLVTTPCTENTKQCMYSPSAVRSATKHQDKQLVPVCSRANTLKTYAELNRYIAKNGSSFFLHHKVNKSCIPDQNIGEIGLCTITTDMRNSSSCFFHPGQHVGGWK